MDVEDMDVPILRRPGQEPSEDERLDVLRGLALGKPKKPELVLPPGYKPPKKSRKRR
jgi:hypothetical protein